MQKLAKEILKCEACHLRKTCTRPVPGEGSTRAKILFIGEAPGAQEDEVGRPFIGRSGQLLRQQIRFAGLDERIYYITNTVLCRPPENRTPKISEITSCWPWLAKTLTILKPKVIVTLGRPALQTMADKLGFKKDVRQLDMRKLAGIPVYLDKRNIYVFPMFHPAFVLRRRNMLEHFRSHMMYLNKAYKGWLSR